MPNIKCGKCTGSHNSVAEVRSCYQREAVQVSAPVKVNGFLIRDPDSPPTERQVSYLRNLGGELKACATKLDVAREIDRLKNQPPVQPNSTASRHLPECPECGTRPAQAHSPTCSVDAPKPLYRTETKVPLAMLQAVPDGYFAVRPDETHAHTFFRFSRPKHGKYKGSLKIQTQHGENYELCLVVYPSGNLHFFRPAYEDDLLLVVVDPNGAAIEYGRVIGRCMRCRKDLTDQRSRHYGIGPECEKFWPHIIQLVDDVQGPFKYYNGS